MNEFIETSKALRIKGVENVFPVNVPNEIPSPDISYYDNIEPEENTDIHEVGKLLFVYNSKIFWNYNFSGFCAH